MFILGGVFVEGCSAAVQVGRRAFGCLGVIAGAELVLQEWVGLTAAAGDAFS